MEAHHSARSRDREALADPVALSVLATIMDAPASAAVARAELGRLWDTAFQDEAIAGLAHTILDVLQEGTLPDQATIRRRLPDDAPADLVSDVMRSVEDPAVLRARCRELVARVQARELAALGADLAADDRSPAAVLEHARRRLSALTAGGLRLLPFGQAVDSSVDQYRAAELRGSAYTGVPTGFKPIDAATGGLPFGQIAVGGGRPGHGKSMVGHTVAIEAALQHAIPTLIISHEMAATQYVRRMACTLSCVSLKHAQAGSLREHTKRRYLAAHEALRKLPITIIDDTACRDPNVALAAVEAWTQDVGRPGLVICDYIQLERIPGFRGQRPDEVAQISGMWLDTIKATKHAALILAQLNRGADGRRPRVADLRDSGQIEQDAALVLMVYQPGQDDPDAEHNVVYLDLGKNRDGGLASAKLLFVGYRQYLRDWHETDQEIKGRAAGQSAEDAAWAADNGAEEVPI